MNKSDLEKKWSSIINTGGTPYKSLRITAECIAELYLALDIKGQRCLILQVPYKSHLDFRKASFENVSMDYYEESNFIVVSLLNNRFVDIFNELILSLYYQIHNIIEPENYVSEFISGFYSWADFFEDASINQLSAYELKGIFGELFILLWYLNNNPLQIDITSILNAWRGPFGTAQDFIFPLFNLEVKTKNRSQIFVNISSEFQLTEEIGKGLQLAILDVEEKEDGTSIQDLLVSIKDVIIKSGRSLLLFTKALSKTGISGNNISLYGSYKWIPCCITFYNCMDDSGFPKITSTRLPTGLSQIKYQLNTTILEKFKIQRIEI